MASIKDMVYEFKLEAEKVDSRTVKTLKVPQIISLLNKGMLLLIQQKYDLDPRRRQAFETNQRRTQELQTLHILHEPLDLSPADSNTAIYSLDLQKTKSQFMYMTRVSFIGNKDKCSQVTLFGHEVQTDDYQVVMQDPDQNPSFEWRRVPYRFGDKTLKAYSDGSFQLVKAEVDYLRYPKKMDIEGYTHFDGKLSKNEECELPEILHPGIVSTAALLFKSWNNSPDVQAQMLNYELSQ